MRRSNERSDREMGPVVEELLVRVYGDATLPTLIYLPGLHGDWTLVTSFRLAMAGHVRFVEFTYPRAVTWSLDDYAAAIESTLLAHGIDRGWLLAESFGSQPAWRLVARSLPSNHPAPASPVSVPHSAFRIPQCPQGFQPEGLILAGGFVRHPVIPGVRLMRHLNAAAPGWALQAVFRLFAAYARFRHRHAPETFDCLGEFVANRLAPGDQAAIVHRLDLIAGHDPRSIAQQTHRPVYSLTALIDPLVPWPFVRPWLRRHCPGYRGDNIIWMADHNVLSSAPLTAARLVIEWMAAGSAR